MIKNALIFVFTMAAIAAMAQTAPQTASKVDPKILEYNRAVMGPDNCQIEMEEYAESYKIAEGKSLSIIPCYMGAYQGASRAYLVEGSGDSQMITQVSVLSYDQSLRAIVSTLDLTSAEYDEKTKTLSTFAKGRGIGDCGQSSVSKFIVDKYGGVSVKTTEIRNKTNCDGKMTNWPVVFKQ